MILNSPTISGSLTVTGNIIASGSITLSGSVASASYAATASFVALAQSASYVLTAQTASFVANAQTASFANAFTVASTLTAQTLVVQTVTSSVSYITGSTRFGSLSSNTHTFTGSMSVSGSLTVASGSTATPLFTVAGGLVGVGMNPVYKLDVGDAIRGLDLIAGGNTFAYDGTIRARNAAGNTNVLLHSNGSSYFVGGSVGIGTTSPAYLLDLYAASGYTARLNGATYGGLILANAGTANSYFVGESTLLSIEHITAINLRTNNADRMRITSGGLVGIGTTSPSEKLHIHLGNVVIAYANNVNRQIQFMGGSGAYENARIESINNASYNDSGYLNFYTARTSSGGLTLKMTIAPNGNIGVSTDGTQIYNASDIRLKRNIETVTYGLDKVLSLNPVKYNWISGFSQSEETKTLLGFVAQEVQNVIPEAVESFSNGGTIIIGDSVIENPLRVSEKFIIPVLVKAIQELKAQNDDLQSQINELKAQ